MQKNKQSKICIYFILMLLFYSSSLPSTEFDFETEDHTFRENQGKFVTLKCRKSSGMFDTFTDVLLLLDAYEKGYLTGVRVDFAKEGLYYDQKHGPNWWQYYCEPINVGQKVNSKLIAAWGKKEVPHAISSKAIYKYNRNTIHDLIQKYIRIKPFLLNQVDNFVEKHFKNDFIIGVHYRGTDKSKETLRVPYTAVKEEIENFVKKMNLTEYKIFVATDEQNFLKYISKEFPGKVCSYAGVIRSSNKSPVHKMREKQFKLGKDAIIDCLLLSKTNFLIRTPSRLSLWSTFFNPELPNFELNIGQSKKPKVIKIEETTQVIEEAK